MSHFCLILVTPNPTAKDLADAMQPFHEFECTGINDQYVVSVDKLPELREKYETDTCSLLIKRPDGSKFYAFDNMGAYVEELQPFLNDGSLSRPDGWEDGSLNLPDGWEEVHGEPVKDYVSFADYATYRCGAAIHGDAPPELDGKHKFGWCRIINGEVTEAVRRTNPNGKWDWFEVGGRYAGRLFAKDHQSPRNRCRVGDLDLELMKSHQVKLRTEVIERFVTCNDLSSFDEADQALKAICKVDEMWRALPEGARPYGAAFRAWVETLGELGQTALKEKSLAFDRPRTEGKSVMDWINSAPAIPAHALLVDGRWQERGKMLMFGVSINNQPADQWAAAIRDIILSLDPDHWITIIDCHT